MNSFAEKSLPPNDRTETPDPPRSSTYPCDESLRARAIALRDSQTVSNSRLGAELGASSGVISQYLSANGCIYPGDVGKLERKLEQYLRSRDLENDWGVATIETPVSIQFGKAVEMIRRCKRIGIILAESGTGKTRSSDLYLDANEAAILLTIKRYGGDEQSVRESLFKGAGIQAPRKHKGRRRLRMMRNLEDALRGTTRPIIVENAHRLSRPAMQMFFDLHDETHSPIIFTAPLELEDMIASDEQWASRIALRFVLIPDKGDWKTVVVHQIKQLIKNAGDDLLKLTRLCEQLSKKDGHFRRVEMRLGMMAYLRHSPENSSKTWLDLFDQAGDFLPGTFQPD